MYGLMPTIRSQRSLVNRATGRKNDIILSSLLTCTPGRRFPRGGGHLVGLCVVSSITFSPARFARSDSIGAVLISPGKQGGTWRNLLTNLSQSLTHLSPFAILTTVVMLINAVTILCALVSVGNNN